MSTSPLEEAAQSTRVSAFTARENAVLKELCKGKSNKQIAGALGIAVPTVRNHLASIMSKLDVGSRCEVIAHLAGNSSTAAAPAKQDVKPEVTNGL